MIFQLQDFYINIILLEVAVAILSCFFPHLRIATLEDADASKSYKNILEKEQLCANAAPVETASHEKCSPLRLWPYSSAQPPASLKLCATIREIKL
jgi:hypothetical protein